MLEENNINFEYIYRPIIASSHHIFQNVKISTENMHKNLTPLKNDGNLQ
jgi:hypothetical protein